MSMRDVPNASEILPQRFNPKFGAATEWNNNAVANIVYIIQDRDYDSNVDTDDIISLLAEWDAERESYSIKTQSHDPDTPMYMEALSGETWKNTIFCIPLRQ